MKFHDFLVDSRLAGRTFDKPSFRAHRIIARLLDGDPHLLDADELAVAREITGRTAWPTTPPAEATIAASRRGGKSLLAAAFGVHAAAMDYRPQLAPGEVAIVGIVAPSIRQSQENFEKCRGLTFDSPLLAAEVVRETASSIEFEHRTRIECFPASHRTTRGGTWAAAIFEEAAQFRSEESATPDVELKRAIMPSLATLRGRLLVISSPYMRRGLLFDAYRNHYGRDDSPHLVVKAPWRVMNPTLSADLIEAAMADDPESARSEWLAEFRSDLSAAFDPAWLDVALDSGVTFRPPLLQPGTPRPYQYYAFCDPAGGGGRDSYTAAVAHAEGGDVVLDATLEVRPPFSTDDATARVASLLRQYGVTTVTADRYAGEWPTQSLARHGIHCLPSERDKSAIYLECIALFSSGRLRLLDEPRMVSQFRNLERKVRAGSHDRVDHPGGMSDDIANSVAGALIAARQPESHDNITTFEVSHLLDDYVDTAGAPDPFVLNRVYWH